MEKLESDPALATVDQRQFTTLWFGTKVRSLSFIGTSPANPFIQKETMDTDLLVLVLILINAVSGAVSFALLIDILGPVDFKKRFIPILVLVMLPVVNTFLMLMALREKFKQDEYAEIHKLNQKYKLR